MATPTSVSLRPSARRPTVVRVSRIDRAVGAAVAVLLLTVAGVVQADSHYLRSSVGVLIAGAASIVLTRTPERWMLLPAAVAVGGVALVSYGSGSNVGWFATCVLTGWMALLASRAHAIAFWLGLLLLFALQWLIVDADAGFVAWAGGVTLSFGSQLVLRRQLWLLDQLRIAQAGLAEQAALAERNRIARELHDVIAHSLTISLMHVSGARVALEHAPQDAARALAEAERHSRESLAEVRSAVGLLRDTAEPDSRPLPGASALPGLVARLQGAGADVRLRVEGDLERIGPTAGLTIYRIAQEALTNAAKHAPGAAVTVDLRVADAVATLAVDSAGAPQHGHGLGTAGMRERAEAVGGTCSAGPGGLGWLVRAEVPIVAQPEPAPGAGA